MIARLFRIFAIGCLTLGLAACGSDSTSLTNADKARAVLEALASQDKTALLEHISAETYIQHNLGFPDGRDAIVGAMDAGQLAGTKVAIKRVLSDGDVVVLHSEYHLFGKDQIAFDIFRFSAGKIVEHWDNLQIKATAPNASGRTMTDGPTAISDADKTAANKTLVRQFVEKVLLGGDTNLIADYIGATYHQHNPQVPDGSAGLEAFLKQVGGGIYTKLHFVHGEGSFVLTVSEGPALGDASAKAAYYDLFRVEGGKIVEHWDVIQTIPAETDWANNNGKF